MTLTLEELYTSREGFRVPATATQRAILRAIEGLPLGELASDPAVVDAFGGEGAIAALPTTPPVEFDLLAGIRTGKSQIAACRALHASQTVDVSGLAAGEVPRVSVLSLDLDKADVVLDHLVGALEARPALRGLLLEPPSNRTVRVRHPSGRPIEIACVAGARAGGAVVARWSAGAIFDEFPRMLGGSEGVVNFDDARRAVLGRLLPGATVLAIGSPWAARGPSFERFTERHGKPGPDHVVVRARAPAMNPTWWSAERVERMSVSNPLVFATDVRAEFADPVQAYLGHQEVRACVRAEPLVLPPQKGRKYVFAQDPATRRNAWTLVGVAFYADDEGVTRFEVVLCKQWQGTPTKPLDVHKTHAEIARIIAPYGASASVTDQHAGDHNREIALRSGYKLLVRIIMAGNSPEPSTGQVTPHWRRYRSDLYETLKGAFSTGVISIPNDPALIQDLLSVRKRVTPRGLDYELPETSDGRHADYAASLALALAECPNIDDVRRYVASAEKTARVLEGLNLLENGSDRDWANHYAKLAEQTRARLNEAREVTFSNDEWIKSERLAWNLNLWRQQSATLTDADVLELFENGKIPTNERRIFPQKKDPADE